MKQHPGAQPPDLKQCGPLQNILKGPAQAGADTPPPPPPPAEGKAVTGEFLVFVARFQPRTRNLNDKGVNGSRNG